MKYLVILDDGHGENTQGKWSPPMNGVRFKENEFNAPVVAMMGAILMRHGVEVFYTAPEAEDIPLSTRCARATKHFNEAKADKACLISVHANADGMGETWTSANGIETFYHPKDPASKPLAELVQKELIAATGLRDRGVKTYNFQILREVPVALPCVLVECGFFTNRQEVELLKSKEYQQKVAVALCKAILSFFGIPYQSEQEPSDGLDYKSLYESEKAEKAALQAQYEALQAKYEAKKADLKEIARIAQKEG